MPLKAFSSIIGPTIQPAQNIVGHIFKQLTAKGSEEQNKSSCLFFSCESQITSVTPSTSQHSGMNDSEKLITWNKKRNKYFCLFPVTVILEFWWFCGFKIMMWIYTSWQQLPSHVQMDTQACLYDPSSSLLGCFLAHMCNEGLNFEFSTCTGQTLMHLASQTKLGGSNLMKPYNKRDKVQPIQPVLQHL